MDCSISNVGDKLQVGVVPIDFPGLGPKLVPGTAVINGPVYIGIVPGGGVPTAACMIGPPFPIPNVTVPASLEVTGISNFLGNINAFGVSTFEGIEIKNSLDESNGVKVNTGAHVTTSNKTITGNLNVTGTCTIGGLFTAAGGVAAPFKKFNIPHPSKEGYRLVYSCLEGPEIGVYIRGKLIESNTIELPYYWKDLVDLETITVNLTSHNTYQELYYKIGEWGKTIEVFNNSGGIIDCSYTIYAERKDLPKLITEYKEE